MVRTVEVPYDSKTTKLEKDFIMGINQEEECLTVNRNPYENKLTLRHVSFNLERVKLFKSTFLAPPKIEYFDLRLGPYKDSYL